MGILKDIQNNKKNMDAMDIYKKFNKDTLKVDYTPQPIRPMKSTTNLILDLNMKNLKSMGSDKQNAQVITLYEKFKGAQALPTFKKNLQSWHICSKIYINLLRLIYKLPKYENGCIYKLVCKDDYDNVNIYIGSTTNFKTRKNNHKTACNNPHSNEYNIKKYQYIRETGGFDNWCMVQIEQYPCKGIKELEARERYWVEVLKSKLNSKISTRTDKEYYENNKEKLL